MRRLWDEKRNIVERQNKTMKMFFFSATRGHLSFHLLVVQQQQTSGRTSFLVGLGVYVLVRACSVSSPCWASPAFTFFTSSVGEIWLTTPELRFGGINAESEVRLHVPCSELELLRFTLYSSQKRHRRPKILIRSGKLLDSSPCGRRSAGRTNLE